MEAANRSAEDIANIRKLHKEQLEQLRRRGDLEEELLRKQADGLEKYGGGITGTVTGILGDVFDSIFDKKKEKKEEDKPWLDEAPSETDVFQEPELEESKKKVDDYGDSLDDIPQKYKDIGKAAGQMGAAILALDEITLKSIKHAIAAELQALAAKAIVKALEYTAIAISAAVFGEWEIASKATAAAITWGTVAVAASAGALLLGGAEGNAASNSQSSAAANAGTPTEYDADKDKELLKQQALSVLIQLDIRTDDGVIIKKNIKAINKNTELTNLTRNSDNSWAFAPAP